MNDEGAQKGALETPAKKSIPTVTQMADDSFVPAPMYGKRARPHRPMPTWTVARGHGLRRDAAQRCEPLADGRRDPCERATVIAIRSSGFGLTPEQLEHERRRLLAMQWSPGEIAVVLGPVNA
jgi:hypothetical protein